MKIPEFVISDKVVCNMKKLYPKHEINRRITAYYISKFKLVGFVIITGVVVITGITLNKNTSAITDEGYIKRNSYGEGDKNVKLYYEIVDENGIAAPDEPDHNQGELQERINGEINVKISEKQYNPTQICKMINKFKEELLKIVLAENKSFDHVTRDLSFVTSIEGYPFSVAYRTDNPIILSNTGAIRQEKLSDEGIDVIITARITYSDYEEEMVFGACIYKRPVNHREEIVNKLEQSIEIEDKKSINTDYYALPSSIDDKKVIFKDSNASSAFLPVAFLIVSAVALFIGKDKDIEKEVEKRDKQLKEEYPRFINRFTLFYTAGMPVKLIFYKLSDEYERNIAEEGERNYLYEEILNVRARLNDGGQETEVYEEFAGRLSTAQYKTFVSLIVQDLRNGRKDLAIVLRRESQEAFTEKINNSKKLLEEAGTKLLAPMFMMLIVVMIMIMFPAFYSFK